MTAAVLVLGVLVVGLVGLSARQHSELVDLRARVRLPDAATGHDTSHRDAIVVVIHNHDDVAAGRNRLARGLSALSPGLVRSLVHREAVRELREQLTAAGIEADVRVRRVVPRPPDG